MLPVVLHMICNRPAPWPFECAQWRKFTAQRGDCKSLEWCLLMLLLLLLLLLPQPGAERAGGQAEGGVHEQGESCPAG